MKGQRTYPLEIAAIGMPSLYLPRPRDDRITAKMQTEEAKQIYRQRSQSSRTPG
jgi:hypothetical protein